MAEASLQGRIHSVFWKDLSAYFLLISIQGCAFLKWATPCTLANQYSARCGGRE